MIIPQQLIQKINSIIANKPLILTIDKSMPALLWEPSQDIVILRIKLDIVLVQVVEQILRAQHFRNFDQLITIRIPMEERLFSENHAREHGSQRPHIQAVVVLLKVDQQLGAFEVA